MTRDREASLDAGMEHFHFTFSAMGTRCSMQLYADSEARARSAQAATIAEVQRLEQRYSRYRSDSLIAAINGAATNRGYIELDEEAAALLDYAAICYQKSGGLFDITSGVLRRAWDFSSGRVPKQHEVTALLPMVGFDKLFWNPPRLKFLVAGMEIDLGGIVKEYAVDRAAELCASIGVEHGLIEFGGDICAIGPLPDGSPWSIGIRHPRGPQDLAATVSLAQGGLASSGDYERYFNCGSRRYCHLLHPTSGWPVQELCAVSVAAKSCLVAGSLATIALLKERSGANWLRSLGVRYLWIDRNLCHGSLGFECTLSGSPQSDSRAVQ